MPDTSDNIGKNPVTELKETAIEKLSEKAATDFVKKQQEILEAAIKDIEQKPRESRKAYTAQHYTHSVAPGVSDANYCLSVNMYACEQANKELGKKVADELRQLSDGLNDKTNAQVSDSLKFFKNNRNDNLLNVNDSTGISYNFNCYTFINKYGNSPYMENGSVHPLVARTGRADTEDRGTLSAGCKDKNITVSTFLDDKGQVKHHEDGTPKLKDGDILLIQTREGNENSTGFHAIRANVDENGQVTYTAGNNEAVQKNLPANWMDASVVVFHTQDYVKDCTKEELRKYNAAQLTALMSEQGLSKPLERVEPAFSNPVVLEVPLRDKLAALRGLRPDNPDTYKSDKEKPARTENKVSKLDILRMTKKIRGL